MTVLQLYRRLERMLDEHADEEVYADIVFDGTDPMPPIEHVYSFDGYVCIGN